MDSDGKRLLELADGMVFWHSRAECWEQAILDAPDKGVGAMTKWELQARGNYRWYKGAFQQLLKTVLQQRGR